MYLLEIAQLQKMVNHIEKAIPCEAAGIILAKEYKQHTYLSFVETSVEENTLLSFRIRDKAINEIAESVKGTRLRICGCFHSHILGPALPSSYDCLTPKKKGELWLIYSVRFLDINIFSWIGTSFRREHFRIVS